MTSVRPARGRLSRDVIDQAALAIVDREGVAALTMRRLGAELGVEAMSLYYHVPGKAALIGRVVARVAGEIRLDVGPGASWQEGLAALGNGLRAALLAHPRAMPLLATHPLDPETGGRLVAPLVGPLRAAGFDEERAYLAIQSVGVFTIGHVLAETGAGDGDEEASDAVGGDLENRGAAGETYYDRWYRLGLGALVRGLEPADPSNDPAPRPAPIDQARAASQSSRRRP